MALVPLESVIDDMVLVVPLVLVLGLAFVATFSFPFDTFAVIAFGGILSGMVVGGNLEGPDFSHACSFSLIESVRHFGLTLLFEIHAGLLFHESCCWVVDRLRGHNVEMATIT